MAAGDSETAVHSIAILGGGLTGLTASRISGAPVFEAAPTWGGVAVSDMQNGFTFDRGIHVLQTGNQKILRLLDESGVRLGRRNRQAYIYSHSVYTAYPFQVNTAGLPFKLRLRCLWGFLTRDSKRDAANYEEWIYATVGQGFAESFLIPYSEKFWTVHPREMTHEWTGNRVPQPKTSQVLRGALWSKQTALGTNAEFRYPESGPGYAAIGDALARDAGPINCDHRAVDLDIRARKVRFANGRSMSYECLISTIPLPELIRICPDAPSDIRDDAARLRCNGILVVNAAVARPPRNNWHWAHFPERDVSFFRISFPHNFATDVVPPGMSSISAEVSYSPDRPVNVESMTQRVIADLIRVGVLENRADILFTLATDIPYAYCIYDSHRRAAVRRLRQWLAERKVVTAGRYGLWSYLWSDQAMNSGITAIAKAQSLLAGDRTATEDEDED